MTKSWKRTEVTIETEMLVIFRRGAETLRAWCERCGAESLMLTPTAAKPGWRHADRHLRASQVGLNSFHRTAGRSTADLR